MKYLLNQWHETQSQQTLGWPVNSTAKPENHFKTWKTRKQVEDNWNRRTRTLWFIRLPGQWPNGVCLFRQSAIPPRTFPCVTRGPKVLTLPRSPKRPKQQTRVTHSAQFVKNKSTKIAYIVRSYFASFRWKNLMSDVICFFCPSPSAPCGTRQKIMQISSESSVDDGRSRSKMTSIDSRENVLQVYFWTRCHPKKR